MLTETQIGTWIGIALRILAAVIFFLFVLPKSRKESLLPNGLTLLRKSIFIGLVIYQIINIFIIIYNGARLIGFIDISVTGPVAIVNGIAELFIAIAFYFLYTSKFG